MKHYTTEELDRYRNGDMNMLSRITCANHLKQCDICRNLLEALKSDDILLESVRKNIARFKAITDELPSNKVPS